MNNRCDPRNPIGRATQALCPRPEEFPLGSPQSRAAARTMLQKNQKRVGIIVHCKDMPLNLANSTCCRYLCPDGITIMEVVEFDGNADELSATEIEEFIARHQ